MMKPTRRILSVLLAAILVAQTGIVAALAADTCGVSDHGKASHNVTDASGCTTSTTHWLGNAGEDKTLTGGSGTNYFYVKDGDIVVCAGTANIIVVNANVSATVTNFTPTQDKIYILGVQSTSAPSGSGTSWTVSNGTGTLTVITAAGDLTAANIGSSPAAALTISTQPTSGNVKKGETVNLTVAPAGAVGTVSYAWEKWTGTAWTPVGTSVASYTVPAGDTGTVGTALKYHCIITDGAGRSVTSNDATVTVTGCEKTVTLKDITGIADTYYEIKEATYEVTLPADTAMLDITGGDCNIHNSDANHGYDITWSVSPADKGVVVVGNSKLQFTAASLPAEDTQITLTATLTPGDTTKTKTFRVKKYVEESCNATATLTSITVPGGNNITENSGTTIAPTSDFQVSLGDGTCNVPSHIGDSNHGYKVTWSLEPADKSYVSIDPNTGTLTITKENLPTIPENVTLKATVTGGAKSPETSVQLTFSRSAACKKTPKSVTVSPATNSLNFTDSDLNTNKDVTFTAAVEWNDELCEIKDHTHGTVVWSIDSAADVWADIDQNGKVTVNGASIPSYTNTITVTASVTANNVTQTGTATLTVTRPKKCDKTITGLSAITGEGTISVSSGTVTKTYTVTTTETGSCEYAAGEAHDTLKNHTIKWEIYSGSRSGISVNADTGVLTVEGSKLSRGSTYTIYLRAYLEGNPSNVKSECSIKITRTGSSGGSTSSDNDNSYSNQWENVQKEIRNADSGDTIKVSLGSNTELPNYVMNELRGENVTLKMTVSGGYVWTINGKTVKKVPSYQIYIPLDVKKYSNSKMLKLCRDYDVEGFQLTHTGSFYGDMKLTIDVGSKYAKDTLYLYSYNESTNKLTYRSSAKANSDGEVTFLLTSSAGKYVITSKALYGESAVSGGGGTVASSSTSTYTPPVSSSTTPSSASSSSSSSSTSSSESSSEPLPPEEPSSSSQEESKPTDTQPEENEKKGGIPVLVPILIIAIAGVITATVLIVRGSGKKKDGNDEDFDD
jgi:hypothetical protein